MVAPTELGQLSGHGASGLVGFSSEELRSLFPLQYATIGDATNVASRICSVAEAGEICIDERAARRLTGGIVLEPLGV